MTDHLQAARAELEAALVAGQDTSKPRAVVARLEGERADAAKAAAFERAADQARVVTELAAAADRITAESRGRVVAVLDQLKLQELTL